MTLDEFIAKYHGKKVDWDKQFGPQCVDLYRQYCNDVFGVKQSPPVTGAKDIWDRPGELVKTAGNLQQGDVLVWDASPSNQYGHVAIMVEELGHGFVVLEQDGFVKDGCRLYWRGKDRLLGGLRKG